MAVEKGLYRGYHIHLGKENSACLFKGRARIQTLELVTLTLPFRAHFDPRVSSPHRGLKELEALLGRTVRARQGPASDTVASLLDLHREGQ